MVCIMQTLVTSCQACATHTHMHGTHALSKIGASMQADPNLVKITASHFQVLNTQNANGNMPNMILIAYLNENFSNFNETLGLGK